MNNLVLMVIFGAMLVVSCTKEQPKTVEQQKELDKVEEAKSGAILLADAREKLSRAKEKLMQEGKYACCIKDPCNHCVLEEGSCPCYHELKAGDHVCVECYADWQQGKGAIAGTRKQDVKTDFTKHEHKH